MRISDWSYDVCSSELQIDQPLVGHVLEQRLQRDLIIAVECEMLRDLALSHRLIGRRNEVENLLAGRQRSEEHTSELQSLMRSSYAVFCLKKKSTNSHNHYTSHNHNSTSNKLRE